MMLSNSFPHVDSLAVSPYPKYVGREDFDLTPKYVVPNYVPPEGFPEKDVLSEMVKFDPIRVEIAKAVTNTAKSIDDYLLSFFGTEEAIKEFGKYYVLETDTSEFETLPDDTNNSFRIQMHTSYRLRLKTKEELEES